MSKTLQAILARIDADLQADNAIWEQGGEYSLEKAVRNAARKNRIADAAAPLLAFSGQVEHITPEALKARYDARNAAYCEQIIRANRMLAERARAHVRRVAEAVSEERLAELEAYRVRVFPRRVEYDCEFWGKQR